LATGEAMKVGTVRRMRTSFCKDSEAALYAMP
jgi:hypothetical protein